MIKQLKGTMSSDTDSENVSLDGGYNNIYSKILSQLEDKGKSENKPKNHSKKKHHKKHHKKDKKAHQTPQVMAQQKDNYDKDPDSVSEYD